MIISKKAATQRVLLVLAVLGLSFFQYTRDGSQAVESVQQANVLRADESHAVRRGEVSAASGKLVVASSTPRDAKNVSRSAESAGADQTHAEDMLDGRTELEQPAEEQNKPAAAPAPTDNYVAEQHDSEASEQHVQSEPPPSPETPPTTELHYETELALEVHRLTNAKRKEHGLPPFVYDAALAHVAERYSAYMIETDHFAHTDAAGCDLSCRLKRVHYEAEAWAENIAWRQDSDMPDAEGLAEHFFERWFESEAHRINILSEVVTREGVGVIRLGNTVYITVDFALPEQH